METNTAKEHISDAIDTAADDAKDKVVQLKGKMESVGSYIDGVAGKTLKEVSEAAHVAGNRITDAADHVVVEVRKYPVQSTLFAFALGVIGTLLLKRSSHR